MSKNYISVRTEYAKASEVVGEIGHSMRIFPDNENVIDTELSKNNVYKCFGMGEKGPLGEVGAPIPQTRNILQRRFNEKYEEMKHQRKKMIGNETLMLESVMAFSVDQFNKVYWDNKEQFHECVENFLQEIKTKHGVEPLGWALHLDEGKKENGEIVLNPHIHLFYMNWDYDKKVAPYRKMKKRDFSQMQDIAGLCFSDFGFRRGVKKSNKKHLKKNEWIEKVQQEQVEQNQKLIRENQDLSQENAELKDNNKDLLEQSITLNAQVRELEHKNAELVKKNRKLEKGIEITKNAFKSLVDWAFKAVRDEARALELNRLVRDYKALRTDKQKDYVYGQIEKMEEITKKPKEVRSRLKPKLRP